MVYSVTLTRVLFFEFSLSSTETVNHNIIREILAHLEVLFGESNFRILKDGFIHL